MDRINAYPADLARQNQGSGVTPWNAFPRVFPAVSGIVSVMENSVPARPAYPIESVDNALRLLLLVETQPALRVSEASEALGVAPSTAHRLFAMLQYHGLVRQDPSTKTYGPGPALLKFGLSVVRDLDLRQVARPALERVSAELGETVHLVVLQGSEVLFVDCVESTKALRVVSRVGAMLPAHCTSVGKALLAELSPQELRVLYPDSKLAGLTSNSITTRSKLESQLEGVRSRGYSTSTGESEDGVGSVGVAVVGSSQRAIAAISAAAPLSRLSKRQIEAMSGPVKEAATQIGAAMP